MPRGVKGSGPYSKIHADGTPRKSATKRTYKRRATTKKATAVRPPKKTTTRRKATQVNQTKTNTTAGPAEQLRLREVALEQAGRTGGTANQVLSAADKFYKFLLNSTIN